MASLATGPSCNLSISDNFNAVAIACQDVSHEWEKLAIHLNINRVTVESIQKEKAGESTTWYLNKLLTTWLRRPAPDQPKPSWRILCDAVCNIDRPLSEKIWTDHTSGCSLCHDLVDDTADIGIQKGADAVDAAYTLYELFHELIDSIGKSFTPNQLKQCIKSYFKAFEGKIHPTVEHHFTKLAGLRSLRAIIKYLMENHFISYINFGLIKTLSHQLTKKDSISLIDEYNKNSVSLFQLSMKDFKTIFQPENPELQLHSPKGLPTFTLHLESSVWRDRSMYQLMTDVVALHMSSNVNSHDLLLVNMFGRNDSGFEVTYAVWPCFTSNIVNRFLDKNSSVDANLSSLKAQGVTIDFSDELKDFMHHDVLYNFDTGDQQALLAEKKVNNQIHQGHLQFVDRTNKSIALKWNRPPNCSELAIIEYQVYYCIPDQTAYSMKTTKTEMLEINGLQPSQEYKFKIVTIDHSNNQTVNEIGEDCFKTSSSLPLPPDPPQLKSFKNGIATITWAPPKKTYKKIEMYRLSYCCVTNSGAHDKMTTCELAIEELKIEAEVNKSYFFRLSAHCGNESSDIVENEVKIVHHTSQVYAGQLIAITRNPKLLQTPRLQKASIDHDTGHQGSHDFTVQPSIGREIPGSKKQLGQPACRVSGRPYIANVTSTSIKLKWNVEDHPSLISNYKIRYSNSTDSSAFWENLEIPGGLISEHTIPNLEPNTTYYFKIKAKRKQNAIYGPYSDISLPITTRSVPTKPIFLKKTDNSITIQWSMQSLKFVSHYVVFKELEHKKVWNRVNSCNYVNVPVEIQDLERGKHYRFKVAAVFHDKYNSESEVSDWMHTEFPLPGPPRHIQFSDVTDDSLFLTWSEPSDNAEHCASYTVYYIHNDKKNLYVTQQKTLKLKVTNLTPETSYQFEIIAINVDGKTGRDSCISPLVRTDIKTPGPPGRPYMLRVTQNSVKMAWSSPSKYPELVSYYRIDYQKKDVDSLDSTLPPWEAILKTATNDEPGMEIKNLEHSTEYFFKVTPFTASGDSGRYSCSEVSEPVCTKSALPSKPGKPKGKEITLNSITLVWDRPVENFDSIHHYKILFYQDGKSEKQAEFRETMGRIEQLKIDGLRCDANGYYFSVAAVTETGESSGPSLLSDSISSDKSIAEFFLPECKAISNVKLPVYLLHSFEQHIGVKNVHMFDIKLQNKPSTRAGLESSSQSKSQRKVLLLVGATGSGKTTLINAMVNHIMRVEYHDHFRLKLIDDPEDISQTHSVTKDISSYTIHHESGFAIPFTLTIIDTPGFGDTAGVERDKVIVQLIKEFFSIEGGINHLNGVGFVCQAGSPRLTSTQRYIINSIFALFGNDVKDNIFLLCTFCDDAEPSVIKAVKEAVRLPVEKYYKFNNSALYALNSNKMSELYSEICTESFKDLFSKFQTIKPVSLMRTQEVMRMREEIETIANSLQENIQEGMSLIENLKKECKTLEENRLAIKKKGKNFEYEVDENVKVKVDLEKGKFTTNCKKCQVTCHYPCTLKNDEEKFKCDAMMPAKAKGIFDYLYSIFKWEWSNTEHDTYCNVCPGHCRWNQHCNASFKWVRMEKRKRKKTMKENFQKFLKALEADDDSIEPESVVIQGIKNEIDEQFDTVFKEILKVKACKEELDKIALIPNYLNDEEYIKLLIEAELQEKKEGYNMRIKQLEALKERAEILTRTGKIYAQHEVDGKRWWEKHFMES